MPIVDLLEKEANALLAHTRRDEELPLLVAQTAFAEWTLDGHLQHSEFAGLKDDARKDYVESACRTLRLA